MLSCERHADLLAVVLIEAFRPLIAMSASMVPIPPPFDTLKDVPKLVNYVAAKANLTGDIERGPLHPAPTTKPRPNSLRTSSTG